jgi:hypothetical protein
MQFVPKTHVPLLAAVEQVADRHQGLDLPGAAPAHAHLHALAAAAHRAAVARRRGEPLPEAEAAHLAELRRWRREREDALRSARQGLRQALGDGDLPSDLMLGNGRLASVRPEEWRTDAGLRAMETGRLRLWSSYPYHETPVMIPKAALAAWLAPSNRRPLRRGSQEECNRWVLKLYQAAADAGPKLERSDAFAQNAARAKRHQQPFSDEQVREAIRQVPDHLKLRPGEKSGRKSGS